MKPWEFKTVPEMYQLLVGAYFGRAPERKEAQVRHQREQAVGTIVEALSLEKNSEVLEIGAGNGLVSRHVAPHVARLHCCEVSESFLRAIRKECREFRNIEFHRIASGDLGFIRSGSLDGIYAHAVFIHLDLYQIYSYLLEARRTLRPGKSICFDIADAREFLIGIPGNFLAMHADFRKHGPRGELMRWNSADAVVKLAEHLGFELVSNPTFLVFRKGRR